MAATKTTSYRRKWRSAFALMLLFAGVLTSWQWQDSYLSHNKNLDILSDILKELKHYYVDDVDVDALTKRGINAMLESLDPYTSFLSEDALEHFQTFTAGGYGGIGALLEHRKGKNLVAMLYKDRPAHKAGLRVGDEIKQINGEEMTGQPLADISSLLKGMPDTSVQVAVAREGVDHLLEFTLNREQVVLKNISYYGQVEQGVGYIKVDNFTTRAAEEVKDALENLKADGIQHLLLDLRGNPGGILEEAVKVANLFIDQNLPVVVTKGKVDTQSKTYKTPKPVYDQEIPLIVLVDANSASASEIVAGVMQDYDRGLVIGKNTYGKGLVQTTRPLSHQTQLKLTVAKYYMPSGRNIQKADLDAEGQGSKQALEDVNSTSPVFKTKAGRPVYEGHAITPDIEVERLKLAPITVSLLKERLFFDYATIFRAEHDDIQDAQSFELSDKAYQSFIDWLKDKTYAYTIEPIAQLLLEQAKKEGYTDDVIKRISTLKNQVDGQKIADLYKFKEEIKLLLQQEIISRYYFQEGAIEVMIPHDQAIQKACSLFQDMAQYHQLLRIED